MHRLYMNKINNIKESVVYWSVLGGYIFCLSYE